MGSVNIKQLARELNLSAATVSRALRDSHEISSATKQRVNDLARKLNYEPNPSASTLRSHKSKTLAVIVPEIANNFFSLAINGIEEVARQHGYHVLIYQSHDNVEAEASFIKSLLTGRADGILLSVASETVNEIHLMDLNKQIPTVFFDRVPDGLNTVNVTTNDYESAYDAAEHLIESGCKKIAYLFALNNLLAGKNRLKGYLNALKDHNIDLDDHLIITCGKDDINNYSLLKDAISKYQPDGVISATEELVLPCYEICQLLKINIPNYLKIVSFSNLKTAPFLNPSLTTVTQPAFEMGFKAASLLLKLLDNKQVEPGDAEVLNSVLIKRGSTAVK
ncbi:LacI family DNA-binding transcriptional regulator [Mucilaginibacter glaciei]|uniref:LacI family DNA-binding transcriptional regulator n=1 Tax=Mucilaginibacter glaciei TaxID=2772109 RepID=A0A926NHJ3_9SPHI|nr:LacI family DNA-binding transcriptional regulator [Mucilaginibacter glaciei]MBD1392174.1 LacI family DNA-binding transcriptional regulator [Mucilaginibacter glaciei]